MSIEKQNYTVINTMREIKELTTKLNHYQEELEELTEKRIQLIDSTTLTNKKVRELEDKFIIKQMQRIKEKIHMINKKLCNSPMNNRNIIRDKIEDNNRKFQEGKTQKFSTGKKNKLKMSNSKESSSYSEDSLSTSLSITKNKKDYQFYGKDKFMNLKLLTDTSEQLLSPEISMLMSPLPIFSSTRSPQLKKKNMVKIIQEKSYLIII